MKDFDLSLGGERHFSLKRKVKKVLLMGRVRLGHSEVSTRVYKAWCMTGDGHQATGDGTQHNYP